MSGLWLWLEFAIPMRIFFPGDRNYSVFKFDLIAFSLMCNNRKYRSTTVLKDKLISQFL